MQATMSPHAALECLLDPIRECLTPEVAKRIADLRATPAIQAQLDLLAEKNAESTLTAEESELYDALVNACSLIAILQAKARRVLHDAGNS